ncbi:MAG: hypothetical protein FWD47_11250 [Treponema sp.]|nr:hypothetical protein [Treponema sp.]
MVNKKKGLVLLVIILVLTTLIIGCASMFGGGSASAPSSFQSGSGSRGDTTILLRQNLQFEQAFRDIVFILNRNGFEPEMMQPEVGYIRTRWNNSWNDRGTHTDFYRVRVIIQFNSNRTQLILSAPAEYARSGEAWQSGFDTRAVETLRNDLTQIIGN